ncbi:MAG: serine/threonine protein kinase [Anaerolineae bacterium]|nr:serine/threonine protein kinase [Anaerolineae bacterium]
MNDPLIGKQLDHYRLEMLLGHGGIARVYRAWDTKLKRHVALKVMDTPLRQNTDTTQRFYREAQTIASLKHPNIIGVHAFGESDGVLYMVMPSVEGADLSKMLAKKKPLAPQEVLRIIREVCSALDYAHARGVIHRDVKPSNILLDKDGRAILSDFGLVLLTEAGTRGEIFGSPHYIAPEQAVSSAKAVPQSDLYSVGIILYEMFTGRLPFDSDEPIEVALKHLQETIPPPRQVRPDIPPALEAVIMKALSKEIKNRYQTGAALVEALQAALKENSDAFPLTAARPSFSDWQPARPKTTTSARFYFLLGVLTTLIMLLGEVYLFLR